MKRIGQVKILSREVLDLDDKILKQLQRYKNGELNESQLKVNTDILFKRQGEKLDEISRLQLERFKLGEFGTGNPYE